MKQKLKYMYILAGLSAIMPAHAETILAPVTLKESLKNNKGISIANSITKEDFYKQVTSFSIYDIIKRGVGISSSESTGEKEKISLRGLEDKYTRISVDGIELPSYGDDNSRYFKVDIIPMPMIGEVKILKNTPASYNADGIGGRIDMKTTKPTNENTYSVDISGGTMHSQSGYLASLYVNRVITPTLKANFAVTNSKYVNSKDETKTKTDSEKVGENTIESETVTQTKFTSGFMGNLEQSYDAGTITFSPIYLKLKKIRDKNESETKLKAGVTEIEDGQYDYREHPSLTAGMTITSHHAFSDSLTLDTSVSKVRTNFTKDKKEYKISKGVQETVAETHSTELQENTLTRFGTDLTKTYADIHTFKTGFVYRTNKHTRDITVIKEGVLKPEIDKEEIYALDERYNAAYIQNETKFKNGWTVLPGVRFEEVIRKGVTEINTKNTSNNTVLPSIISNYKLSDTTSFSMAYSKKVNRPSYQQLVPYEKAPKKTDKEIQQGNPDLLAEKADTFDIGVDYTGTVYGLSANIFRRNIKGIIENVDTGTTKKVDGTNSIYQYQNVGDGYVQGLELSQKFDVTFLKSIIPGTVSLDLNQTIMSSKVNKSDGTSASLKGQSDFMANSTIGWAYKSVYASVSSKFEKGHTEVDGKKTTTTPDSTYVDIYAQYGFDNGGAIYTSVTNAFDQGREPTTVEGTETEVETKKGYRSVWAGYKISF